MTFQVHTLLSAPEAAKPQLEKAIQKIGFLPNLFGVMAEAPTVPEAYLAVNDIFEKASLSAEEREVLFLAATYANACTYCIPAHTVIASRVGLPNDVVNAIRDGRSITNPRLEALRVYTESVTETRGRPDGEKTKRFFEVGYTKAQALEVMLGVSIKTLSNYVNHLADIPLDEEFKAATWERPTTVQY